MERYIALLRGINVGGKRIIKMDDLKTVLSSIGLKNIITYIQSGNIIFDYPKCNIQVLEEKMEKEVFIYCEGKYHLTKISNTFFEKNLKTPATSRNWKTVTKILDLAKGK